MAYAEAISSLGPYQLGAVLGRGSFATVRAGVHLPTGEKVAVKFILKDLMVQEPYWKDNLYREVEVMKRLRHPNIVQLYEVCETENFICLVLELASCDMLSHLLSLGVYSENDARKYARQLVSALEHMHYHNVVHRDLKMENLMLSESQDLRIIDFGLSGDMTSSSSLKTICGSLSYSAPELVGHKPYGKEVDIWSLGVCLCVMLTGTLPFNGDRVTDLHAAMLEGGFTAPPSFSPPLRNLITSIFQVKPAKRITISGLKQHEWIIGSDGYIFPITTPILTSTTSTIPFLSTVTRSTSTSSPSSLSSPTAPTATTLSSSPLPAQIIDKDIISHMMKIGHVDQAAIEHSLNENLCDRLSATYYLHQHWLQNQAIATKIKQRLENPQNGADLGVTRSASISSNRHGSFSSITSDDMSNTSTTKQRFRNSISKSFDSHDDHNTAKQETSSRRVTPIDFETLPQSRSRQSSFGSQSSLPGKIAAGRKIVRTSSGRRTSTSTTTTNDMITITSIEIPEQQDDFIASSSEISHSAMMTKWASIGTASHSESPFAKLLMKVIESCGQRNDGLPFRRNIAKECHSALLFTPDSSLYELLVAHGWNGLEFTSISFDPLELAADIRDFIDNLPVLQPSFTTSKTTSGLSATLPRSSSQSKLPTIQSKSKLFHSPSQSSLAATMKALTTSTTKLPSLNSATLRRTDSSSSCLSQTEENGRTSRSSLNIASPDIVEEATDLPFLIDDELSRSLRGRTALKSRQTSARHDALPTISSAAEFLPELRQVEDPFARKFGQESVSQAKASPKFRV